MQTRSPTTSNNLLDSHDSGATELPPPQAPIPSIAAIAEIFPQYEILEVLGRGGMGVVYKARQKSLDRLVALKLLLPAVRADASFSERFAREARALARLNHPNIVTVYDFATSNDIYSCVVEYVDGYTLRQAMRSGDVTPRVVLELIPQICDAIQFAHDEGIIHRDIKPENVLLDRRGRVKVADFGLAKLLGHSRSAHTDMALTRPEQMMGTPNYMAPEQFRTPLRVDHRADLYAVGVVLYEMLTGELPIGRFPPPSERHPVDPRFDEIVFKALDKDPDRRYQQAKELRDALDTIRRGAAETTAIFTADDAPAAATATTTVGAQPQQPSAASNVSSSTGSSPNVAPAPPAGRFSAVTNTLSRFLRRAFRSHASALKLHRFDGVFCFSPENHLLAALQTGQIAQLEYPSGRVIRHFGFAADPAELLRCSPNNTRLIVRRTTDELELMDLASGDLITALSFPTSSWKPSATFSPDGARFAVAVGASPSFENFSRTSGATAPPPGATIHIYSSADGKLLNKIAASGIWIHCSQPMDWQRNLLAVADAQYDEQGHGTCLWDVENRRPLHRLAQPGYPLGGSSVRLSPDASLLAVGFRAYHLGIWHARTGKHLRILRNDGGPLWRIDFSPDARFLAAGESDSVVHLWDAGSGDEIAQFEVGPRDHLIEIHSLAFDKTGQTIACGVKGKVFIWDVPRPKNN